MTAGAGVLVSNQVLLHKFWQPRGSDQRPRDSTITTIAAAGRKPREWFRRHPTVFELTPVGKDGHCMVRILGSGAAAATAGAAGAGAAAARTGPTTLAAAAEADREAVVALVELLRTGPSDGATLPFACGLTAFRLCSHCLFSLRHCLLLVFLLPFFTKTLPFACVLPAFLR